VRAVSVPLIGKPCNPRVLTCGSAQRHLAEEQVVAVLLNIFPELVPMILIRSSESSREDIPISEDPLHIAAEIVTGGFQGFLEG
jgi:hypothetical protein